MEKYEHARFIDKLIKTNIKKFQSFRILIDLPFQLLLVSAVTYCSVELKPKIGNKRGVSTVQYGVKKPKQIIFALVERKLTFEIDAGATSSDSPPYQKKNKLRLSSYQITVQTNKMATPIRTRHVSALGTTKLVKYYN